MFFTSSISFQHDPMPLSNMNLIHPTHILIDPIHLTCQIQLQPFRYECQITWLNLAGPSNTLWPLSPSLYPQIMANLCFIMFMFIFLLLIYILSHSSSFYCSDSLQLRIGIYIVRFPYPPLLFQVILRSIPFHFSLILLFIVLDLPLFHHT